jgi:hypothetical protein
MVEQLLERTKSVGQRDILQLLVQAHDLGSAKQTEKQQLQGTRYLEAGERDWALGSPLEPPSGPEVFVEICRIEKA